MNWKVKEEVLKLLRAARDNGYHAEDAKDMQDVMLNAMIVILNNLPCEPENKELNSEVINEIRRQQLFTLIVRALDTFEREVAEARSDGKPMLFSARCRLKERIAEGVYQKLVAE